MTFFLIYIQNTQLSIEVYIMHILLSMILMNKCRFSNFVTVYYLLCSDFFSTVDE